MISALLNGDKDLKSCDKPYVHDDEYQEQQETPYFHASTTARELNKYKIGNNDFVTILGSENLNSMIFTTNYCSNPTENALGSSIGHTESPWTLNITPIALTSSGDLILGSKNRFITILDVFDGGSLHEVARIGSEFIGLGLIFTKYNTFLTRHTQYVWVSNPGITLTYMTLLS